MSTPLALTKKNWLASAVSVSKIDVGGSGVLLAADSPQVVAANGCSRPPPIGEPNKTRTGRCRCHQCGRQCGGRQVTTARVLQALLARWITTPGRSGDHRRLSTPTPSCSGEASCIKVFQAITAGH